MDEDIPLAIGPWIFEQVSINDTVGLAVGLRLDLIICSCDSSSHGRARDSKMIYSLLIGCIV